MEYRFQVVALHPKIPGIECEARYDGFRRNFLNLFQVNPRVGMLANNAGSDPVGFCLYQYAEMARHAPPLADGLTALDLVRMTLERHLDGARSYGLIGYGPTPEYPDCAAWKCPYDSLDTYPSLLMSAAHYVQGAEDWHWAERHWTGLRGWIDTLLALDRDGNGLIEYPLSGNSGIWDHSLPGMNPLRPANWWDTIGFGHEDAYSNALAYRACVLMAEVAKRLDKNDDAARLIRQAERLRAGLLCRPSSIPETGLLAGWRSQDGKLHDYAFTFIQGLAVSFDLVDASQGNALLDRLGKKIREVGFDRFEYGLPGNLVSVRPEDYHTTEHRFGGSTLAGWF